MYLCIAVAAAAAEQPVTAISEPGSDPAEIIVTGERSRRTLQETASSVDVVTSQEIEAQPVDRVEQLLAGIPNVQGGNGSQGPAIRGLDTTGALQALPAFLGGNRPRTTLVVDGRAVTYNEFVLGTQGVWDLDRLEVFRSPQTTTQGQNSIAGAIFAYTNDPSFEPEFRARAIAGDFRTRQVSAVASGPLSGDSIAFRIAGDLRYARTTALIADRAEGADPNHDVYGTVRAKLLIAPPALPSSQLVLTYAHSQSQAPQVVQVSPPFRDRRDDSGFYGTFRINTDSLTAAARHEAGDLSARLLVTAGDTIAQRYAFPGLGQARNDGRDWSAEAVVEWQPAGPFDFLAGAAHRHVSLKQSIDLSVLSGMGRFRDRQLGTGLFAEGTIAVFRRTKVTGGLRYQRDSQRRTGTLDARSGTVIPLDYDRSFASWLPKLSISHDLGKDVTIGGLIQKAHNPGGTTLRFDTGLPDEFEAESLWDYEVFVRGVFAEGRLSANANLFYYDMKNAQRSSDITIFAPNGMRVGFADLFNVPKARSYGLEWEVEWRPNDRVSARLGIGLLRTKIVEAGADRLAFQGKEFDRSPGLTASASVDWNPFDRLRLAAQARHHSSYWSDPLNRPPARVGRATIVDARAEYGFGRFSLFGYARNAFDSFAYTWRSDFSATLEDPRELGFGLEARF